ncbi:WXG100 family type VII secretion target [Sanguibacter antarcticus]|uniref:ESAT-6-like protein n=1 Tax=Sanguibacter antarcticus TaxID=372484 RepID=A0A2A9E1T6_9MICO|nr:WXG100 family type VII secretion target [Sanguibacter antarcticus]PFG32803.1 WXG100 family type VII secretion target [Sanguibacter antarcticus]
MAGEVSAVEGALEQGAQAVVQSRTELQKELVGLEGKLSSIGSSWTGQGAVAFTQLMARWRDDASKMVGALNDFEANLRSSSTAYDSADETQSTSMTHLTQRLG